MAESGTATRRIRLDVSTGSPNLSGINQATNAVNRLNAAMRSAVKWSAMFQRITGVDMKSVQTGATGMAASVTKAMAVADAATQKSAKNISGALQSTTNALKTFTKTGAQTRLEEERYKAGHVTSISRTRLSKEPGKAFETVSTESVTRTDLNALAKTQAAEKKRQEEDAARLAQNRQRMLNIQNREREEGIARQAAMDAEMDRRRQASWSRVAKEQVYRAQHTVAGLSGTPGDKARGVIAAQERLVSNLTRMANRTGIGAELQEQLNRQIKAAQLRIARAYGRVASIAPPIIPKRGGGFWESMWGGQNGWLDRGLRGWTPMGFTKNMLTAGGWMAAVTAPMQAIQLGGYSIERSMQLQLQTARLTQVFQKAGGTAKDLSDDVLSLAAAEGRGTEEAIQAAIQWSRLGLSRKQAAEATRVSLMGANVAEMTAAESTQHLSAVLAGYNLQVSDLDSVLGMLNQSSNTYRVTNKDLLEGLSRVSSVAQQAGISLARLQGMLAASVQKTGQTGANMANAIKTVLVRLNRPDVKQFFAERFDVDVSGTEESLNRVWSIYQKSNDEQRQDILLKVGAATQANRFRAILESYTEGVVAAAESLRNLNSAEKENLLITNTAAAARQRLVSSWDRIWNGDIGTNILAKGFNAASGVLSGIGNATGYIWPTMAAMGNRVLGSPLGTGPIPSSYAPKFGYFDPKKASPATALSVMAGPWSLALPQTWSGLGFSGTPSTAEDKWKVAIGEINSTRSAGESDQMLSEEYRRIAKLWGGIGGKERGGILESLKRVLPPGVAEQLGAGDSSGLMREADMLGERAKKSLQAAQERNAAEIKNRESEVQKLREAKGSQKEIAELTRQIGELRKDSLRYLEAETELLEDQDTRLERTVRQMAIQKAMMEDVVRLSGQWGGSSRMNEVLSLQAQIAQTRALPTSGVTLEEAERRNKFMRENQARVDALRSRFSVQAEVLGTATGVARSMAEMEVRNKGTGITEGERLLDRRLWIEKELARYSDVRRMGANDLQRAQVLTVSLLRTQEGIEDRIQAIQRERIQIQKEANREFQRSLIGSSPSQLLSKLASYQLSKGGMNAGKLFSMSPESQRDAWTLMGGDRMADLNRESSSLGGQGMSLQGLQNFAVKIQEQQNLFAEAASKLTTNSFDAARAVEWFTAALTDASTTLTRIIAGVGSSNGGGSPTASAPANFIPVGFSGKRPFALK